MEKEHTLYNLGGINFIAFIIGLSMIWHLTHNWIIMFWAFVASLHFTIKS